MRSRGAAAYTVSDLNTMQRQTLILNFEIWSAAEFDFPNQYNLFNGEIN
jgi:hypothetical protein